jgi:hypothetical protein
MAIAPPQVMVLEHVLRRLYEASSNGCFYEFRTFPLDYDIIENLHT